MNEDKIQIFNIVWRDIPITIRFNPNWSNAHREIYGFKMTHLEIIRDDRKQLPITSTGYTSRFMDERGLEGLDITAFVIDWLNHEASSKSWKAYLTDQQQLKLF